MSPAPARKRRRPKRAERASEPPERSMLFGRILNDMSVSNGPPPSKRRHAPRDESPTDSDIPDWYQKLLGDLV